MPHGRQRTALVATLLVWLACGCTREARVASTPVPLPGATPGARVGDEPRMVFAEAVANVEHGADDTARALFLSLLDRYPLLEDYHLAYLAALEERAGRLAEAARYDDRLLASHPDSVWVATALTRRARVAAALGDRATASALAARARNAPDADPDTRAAADLVEADLRAGDDPRAAYALYQAARRAGGGAAALARTRSTALEGLHPELLEDAELLLNEGTLLLSEGRLENAAVRFEHGAQRAGDATTRSAALRGLAKVRQREGRIDDAIVVYRQAAEAEPPPRGTAWFELATLLWNRDRDDEADALFARLLRESPGHPKRDGARYALGRIAEQSGNLAQATTHYRRLIATGSDGELIREARWRIAWSAYRTGATAAAIEAFGSLARSGGPDEAAGLYWLARTRATREAPDGATQLYGDVITRVPDSYYAGLAEQRLGTSAPAPPAPQPLDGDPSPGVMANAYHWMRSQELHAVTLDRAAAREIDAIARAAPAGPPDPYLLTAYSDAGAHGRALRLAREMQSQGTLSAPVATAYLYPRAYWTLVGEEAAGARLDPYLVLALMRQESLFDPEARSPADAYGLMQLLVRTASRVAGSSVDAAELSDPATNVRLGTRYLRQLLDRFDGSLIKAVAAYNAGEDAVDKWVARAGAKDDDEFVEDISFRETRKYVKIVLANYRQYRRLYGAPGEQRAASGSRLDEYRTSAE